jgi:hypothetical protein
VQITKAIIKDEMDDMTINLFLLFETLTMTIRNGISVTKVIAQVVWPLGNDVIADVPMSSSATFIFQIKEYHGLKFSSLPVYII